MGLNVGYFPGSAENAAGLGMSTGGSLGLFTGDWNVGLNGDSGGNVGVALPVTPKPYVLPFECHINGTCTQVGPVPAWVPECACEEAKAFYDACVTLGKLLKKYISGLIPCCHNPEQEEEEDQEHDPRPWWMP